MRLVTYETDGWAVAGILLGEELVDAAVAARAATLEIGPPTVRGLLTVLRADGLRRLDLASEELDERIPLDSVRLHAPVPDPEKIVCLGLNYRDHAEEARQELPEHPMWFPKFANSLIGPGESIVLPAAAPEKVDYEAELAVVIGRPANRVSEADALSHVAGAMAFNDVSARDLQFLNPLWTTGKAVDTFGPCGPSLVLMDEIDDLQDIALRTRIDGEVVQEGTTADQIFGVAEVVSWLSSTMTLVPGDVIATGTPAGIGGPKGLFLQSGQTVEVEAEGLGAVANPIVAERS
jgi:acylpyruvate hydrolase